MYHPYSTFIKTTSKNSVRKIPKGVKEEIEDWFENLKKDDDIEFLSHIESKNIIRMSMEFNKCHHVIDVIYPRNYPTIKIGFSAREVSRSNNDEYALKFISIADEQFRGKVLSISRVLTHLETTFEKYKLKRGAGQKRTSAKETKTKSTPSKIQEDIWDEQSNKNVTPKRDTDYSLEQNEPDPDDWSESIVKKQIPNETSSSVPEKIELDNMLQKIDEPTIPSQPQREKERGESFAHHQSISDNNLGSDLEIINSILNSYKSRDIVPGTPMTPDTGTNEELSTEYPSTVAVGKETILTTNNVQKVEYETQNGMQLDDPFIDERKIVGSVTKQSEELVPSENNATQQSEKISLAESPAENHSIIIDIPDNSQKLTDLSNNHQAMPQSEMNIPENLESPSNAQFNRSSSLSQSKMNTALAIVNAVAYISGKSNKRKFRPVIHKITHSPHSYSPIVPKKKPIRKTTRESRNTTKRQITKDPTPDLDKKNASKNTEPSDRQVPKTENENYIFFDDVNDPVGLYLDLDKYLKDHRMPFDVDKLMSHAEKIQEEMSFGSVSKVYIRFSPRGAIRVVINEFINLYRYGMSNHFRTWPINDNVYHLGVSISPSFFATSSRIYQQMHQLQRNIELEIFIDAKLHPFYPPKLKLISPRLKNNLNVKIATMDCIQICEWKPTCSLQSVLNHFRDIMNDYAEIDMITDFYLDLENDLIDLCILSGIRPRSDCYTSSEIQIDIKSNFKNQPLIIGKTTKQYWASGTGYGHEGQAEWNIKHDLIVKEEREKQLQKCIQNITKHLTKLIISNNSKLDPVQILSSSCFVPYLKSVLQGISIMELLMNLKRFESILNAMRILPLNFLSLFTLTERDNDTTLFTILTELEADCCRYLETMDKLMQVQSANNEATVNSTERKLEMDLVTNFISFHKRLKTQMSFLEKYQKNTINQITEKSIISLKEKYVEQLSDELCYSCAMDLSVFDYLKEKDDHIINPKSVQYIVKELVSLSKSLPLTFESSIFYRYHDTNLKYHQFLITGPEGSPYDSGCFRFMMYCTSKYPDTNPLVRILTTGGGTVRFNPNLYSNGNVCLTILGTWNGHPSESWIPWQSTMFQIMLSIQSLVLNATPYFNEPGVTSTLLSPDAKELSDKYNYPIRLNTMKWAMIDVINNPVKEFEKVIKTHFKLKSDYIKQTCAKWVAEAPSYMKKDYENTYLKLCELLDNLHSKED